MNTEQQRKEFEEWATSNESIGLDLDMDVDDGVEHYWDHSTYAAWKAWQAAREQVTKQRDELLRYNEAFRKETLICADCDSISKEEYDQAIEQRDRLAEALQKLADCDWVISLPDRMDAVRSIAREALQSLTTNKEDQERKSPASDGSI
jgi:hypothetical protein